MAEDVDAWMAKYENPMKPLVEVVRQIVLGAGKRLAETIKWQSPDVPHRRFNQGRLSISRGRRSSGAIYAVCEHG